MIASNPDIQSLLEFIGEDDFRNRALGCIYGSFIADSIGSFLEMSENPSQADVELALTMPGGGYFGTAPGQFTDDSDLALCVAYGITDSNGALDLNSIAKYYKLWIHSRPFSLGKTTERAFRGLTEVDYYKKESDYLAKWEEDYCKNKKDISELASKTLESASKNNQTSESNGSIMRLATMHVFCSRLKSLEEVQRAVKAELSMTHPKEIVHRTGFCLTLAARHLINNAGDMKGALQAVREYIQNQTKKTDPLREWWELVERDQFDFDQHPTWIKIPFVAAFIYLKKGRTDVENIIKEIISRGGDTDTNACIVTALIGAAVGFKSLPLHLVEKLLNCDFGKGKYPSRYMQFHPKATVSLVPKFISCLRDTLELIGYK